MINQTNDNISASGVIKMTYFEDSLISDVKNNYDELQQNDTQLNRRNYVRSLFALYEVILSNLRETTCKLLVDDFDLKGIWEFYKLIPLLDDNPRLTEKGKLGLESNRIPFLSLVEYTIRTYAEFIGLNENLFDNNGWNSFCLSIKIRDRITHPSSLKEVDITDEEMNTLKKGWEWWNSTLKKLRETHLEFLTKDNNLNFFGDQKK